MTKHPAVYILASDRNGTLCVVGSSATCSGVSGSATRQVNGFTDRYRVHHLLHYALCEDMLTAITREKQLKSWKRAWKLRLIEENNPTWRDLWEQICS